MSKKWDVEQSFGRRFGKTDLDRIGFFHDPSPAPFDEYRGPVEFRVGVEKGRQLLSGPSGGLFEEKFMRIFNGEALSEPWRKEAEERLQQGKRKVGGRMLPPSPSKKHSTPGDWHGCFDKPPYLGPATKGEAKKEKELPNMKIKPNPLGGPGYAGIGLNPYPSHSNDPYDPVPKKEASRPGRFLTASAPLDHFPPNPYEKDRGPTYVRPTEAQSKMIGTGRFYVPFPKKPGGNHSGCFEKFPSYADNPYAAGGEKAEAEPVFLSSAPSFRSKYTNSIVEQITKTSCNSNNYLEYRERAYPLRK